MKNGYLFGEKHPVIVNPGFEEGMNGWESQGAIAENGHVGSSRLTHSKGKIETIQHISGMANGWYTLKVWVQSSKDHRVGYIALKDCGSDEVRANIPYFRSNVWLQVVVSTKVRNGKCTISLVTEIEEDDGWVSFDDAELVSGQAALPIRGADISSLKKSEDLGGKYAFEDGREADALDILKSHGMNYARIRVWVNSPDGYHGKQQLLEMAKRYKEKGIKFLVDFHYSDSWADPGKQNIPAAWAGLDFDELKQALYDHTYDVCRSLVEQGTEPDMVQIGNEINNGMLWPDGKTDNWDNLTDLLKEGYRAVKECSPDTKVMLQLAEGADKKLFRWWFDEAVSRDVKFDVIGVSFYPYWHGSMADFQVNMNDIADRYGRDIILVETAYPFTMADNDGYENIIDVQTIDGYPATTDGQARILQDLANIVMAIPGGRGIGIFYWDATWTAVKGNGWEPARPSSGNNWENQALFDYDNKALPGMNIFSSTAPKK